MQDYVSMLFSWEMLVTTVIDFFMVLFQYLATALIVHCFYDDAVVISRKRAAFVIVGFPVTMIAVMIVSLIIGIAIGRNMAENGTMTDTFLISDLGDRVFLIGGSSIFFWVAAVIAAGKGIGFRKGLLRFLIAFGVCMLISFVCSLPPEMIRYCITETGISGKHVAETSMAEMMQLDIIRLVLAVIITLLLYFRVYKKGIALRLRKIDVASVLFYAVIALLINILFETVEKQGIPLAGGSLPMRIILVLFMLLLILLIPLLILRNRLSASYKELTAYQQNFLETELNASRQYRAAQEDTRAFRHDVQNNLTAVAMLMEEGKIGEAKRYLDDMRTEVSALSPKVVTGDDMVDALISSKLAKMAELGITFSTDGVIDGGLNWKPMDICTVFANLLDNAIEAAAQTENGFVRLSFRKSEHHRLIEAVNSCPADVDCDALMLGGSHITGKQDKALHGYGIGNIRKTVEKYGGMMKLSCAEHVFTMQIVLMK